MKRGQFAYHAFKLALSATEPDVSTGDRAFAVYVAIDLLPTIAASLVERLLPRVVTLVQLVEPGRRPSGDLRRGLKQLSLYDDKEIRGVVDELVKTTEAGRQARFHRTGGSK